MLLDEILQKRNRLQNAILVVTTDLLTNFAYD